MSLLSTIASTPPETRVVVKDGKVSFQTPYFDPWFIEDLHVMVPLAERSFYRDTSTWIVPVRYLGQLVELVKVSFGSIPEVI